MTGHTADLTSIAFSPTGTEVVTTSIDKTARIWDALSGLVLAQLDVAEQTNAAVFVPDGALVIVGSGNPGVAPASISHRQTVIRWDWRAEKITRSIDACDGGAVTSVAISPDGQRVAFSGSMLSRIWEWDGVLQRRVAVTEPQQVYVLGVSFTPDNRRLVSLSWDSSARIWDADTADLLLVISHKNLVGVAVSPSLDSSRIATSDGDSIYLWESRSTQELESAALVDADFAQPGSLSADVVGELVRDLTLSPVVRETALRLARRKADDPATLNDRAKQDPQAQRVGEGHP